MRGGSGPSAMFAGPLFALVGRGAGIPMPVARRLWSVVGLCHGPRTMDHGPPQQLQIANCRLQIMSNPICNLQSEICNQKGEHTVQDQTLEEVLEDWKEERISAKEAIGELLRHLQLLLEQLRALERRASANSPPTPPAPAAAKRAAKRR